VPSELSIYIKSQNSEKILESKYPFGYSW